MVTLHSSQTFCTSVKNLLQVGVILLLGKMLYKARDRQSCATSDNVFNKNDKEKDLKKKTICGSGASIGILIVTVMEVQC